MLEAILGIVVLLLLGPHVVAALFIGSFVLMVVLALSGVRPPGFP